MSVRGRLTLWYGAALLLTVTAFSAVVFLTVRAELEAQAQHEVDEAWRSVEEMCRHDPEEVYELEMHGRLAYFEVHEGDRLVHRTERWSSVADDVARAWRVKRGDAGPFRIAVAHDETSSRSALRTLALVLGIGIPIAALVALAGGYGLAGRVLKPVGAMALRAREITAERLSDRLPVDDPKDEFGRLATVFNDTLTRLHASFEQLRRFTADASHELRTPLTALRSVGEVALQGDQTAAGRDAIGSMLEEVDRLSRLVESLLFLTRADAGGIRPARERVDLGELASATSELLRVLAEEKGQTLDVDAKSGTTVTGDAGLLRQALMNLVDNAIKYTPSGGRIAVRVGRGTDGQAVVEVKDTGRGIPDAARPRVFERFYRVDAARNREDGGAGLGLAIARWAVEANGGRIELESAPGAGSTLRIVLPRE